MDYKDKWLLFEDKWKHYSIFVRILGFWLKPLCAEWFFIGFNHSFRKKGE